LPLEKRKEGGKYESVYFVRALKKGALVQSNEKGKEGVFSGNSGSTIDFYNGGKKKKKKKEKSKNGKRGKEERRRTRCFLSSTLKERKKKKKSLFKRKP